MSQWKENLHLVTPLIIQLNRLRHIPVLVITIQGLQYYFMNKKKLYKTYICENCHENFKDIRKYDFHRTMCMKRYCSTCKHRFLSPCTFRHVSNCLPRQFQCTICHKTFSHQSYRNTHGKKQHYPVQKQFVCHFCTYQCLMRKQFNLHIQQAQTDICPVWCILTYVLFVTSENTDLYLLSFFYK